MVRSAATRRRCSPYSSGAAAALGAPLSGAASFDVVSPLLAAALPAALPRLLSSLLSLASGLCLRRCASISTAARSLGVALFFSVDIAACAIDAAAHVFGASSCALDAAAAAAGAAAPALCAPARAALASDAAIHASCAIAGTALATVVSSAVALVHALACATAVLTICALPQRHRRVRVWRRPLPRRRRLALSHACPCLHRSRRRLLLPRL